MPQETFKHLFKAICVRATFIFDGLVCLYILQCYSGAVCEFADSCILYSQSYTSISISAMYGYLACFGWRIKWIGRSLPLAQFLPLFMLFN